MKMKKDLDFYMFDEHIDYVKECEKMGFSVTKQDDLWVEEFEKNGRKYSVLGVHDCYSGWEINIAPSGDISFDDLLHTALNPRAEDERFVCMGLILKRYYSEIFATLKNDISRRKLSKNEKKLLKLIVNNIRFESDEVSEMKELIDICSNPLKGKTLCFTHTS